jgi:hypothetical protein
LHDIQARTAEALPWLLRELKRRGYHIVHVVPATRDLPRTATVPSQWIAPANAHQIWPAPSADTKDAMVPAPPDSKTGSSLPRRSTTLAGWRACRTVPHSTCHWARRHSYLQPRSG